MNEQKIKKDIAAYGCSIIAIEGTDYLSAFAHTIGLWEQYQHPEIILFGLTPGMMQNVLNEATSMIQSGNTIKAEQTYSDFFENGHTACIEVAAENIRDYFGYAIDYYKDIAFPAVQLVWTDAAYHFPWDQDFDASLQYKQPLLDRNAAFKFSEDPNLSVYVSAAYQAGTNYINTVKHLSNGDWHFLSDQQLPEQSIPLATLVAQDPSINQLFDLDYGQMAERTSPNAAWERSLIP